MCGAVTSTRRVASWSGAGQPCATAGVAATAAIIAMKFLSLDIPRSNLGADASTVRGTGETTSL
jgi:hypothetical protein